MEQRDSFTGLAALAVRGRSAPWAGPAQLIPVTAAASVLKCDPVFRWST